MKIIPKSKKTIAKFSMGQQTKQKVEVIGLKLKKLYTLLSEL